MIIVWIILCGFLLDIMFGDPKWLPHYICLIGNAISKGEKLFRRIKNEFIAGMLLSLAVILLSFITPFIIIFYLNKINFILSIVVQIFFAFQIFAAKSLKTESMRVFYPLIKEDLPNARKYLSWIVGRDTQNLDKEGITKATVETVAENTTDGVIAPLFYMAIGGIPLAIMYKAINTLDSMIGYKNEKYLYFGRFAARRDDVVNFVPARISAILMIAASFILRLDTKNAIKIYIRDRKKHASPNSAQTEAVCAGALNVQLAGDAFYFGKLYKKPTIGDKNREVKPEDIKYANRLMFGSASIGVFIFCLVRYFIG